MILATASPPFTRRLCRLLSLLLLPAVLLSLFAPSMPAATAQNTSDPGVRYTVTQLLAPNGRTFYATDLNDLGQVAGYYEDGLINRAGIWQNGSVTALDSLGGSAVASGINNSGQLSGWIFVPTASGHSRLTPVRWQGGVPIELPYRTDTFTQAYATMIGESGLVGGQLTYLIGGGQWYAAWQGNQDPLFNYFRSGNSVPHDINSTDLMVGSSSLPPFWNFAFSWQYGANNAAVELPHLGQNNGASSAAYGVNDAGVIVGYSGRADSIRVPRPVIWEGGAVRELPSLPAATAGDARAINNSNQIIGTNTVDGGTVPVIWLNDTPYRLQSLLDTSASVSISTAARINNRGQILSQGTYNGVSVSLLLTPSEAPAELAIDSVTLEHGDYPSASWIAVPAEGTTDGNIVRITVRVRNPGQQPVEALIDVAESVANTKIGFTCPDRVSVPPTGSGAPHEVRCTWNTSLYAFGAPFSEDGAGTPKPDRVVRVTLAPVGGTVSTLDTPVKIRPRPVFMVQTINSTAEYIGALAELLSDNPARWTFLPVPGLASGGRNGDEASATLEENSEALHRYVEQQRATLDAWKFDIIAHGYGGLVARNYIATYEPTVGQGLSAAQMLITLGTPNLGTPCAAPFALANIVADNPNTSAWVAQLPNTVREFNSWAAGRMAAFAPYAVGGSADQLRCLGHPYLASDPGNPPSDRLVPYVSAVYGSEIAAEVNAAHSTYILDLDVKWQVADWLASLSVEWVLPRQEAVPTQATTSPAESVQPAPIAEVLPIDLPAAATVERTITVPAATALSVSFPAARTLMAELVSPGGQVLASTTVTETESLGLRVDSPVAGQWTLRLRSSGPETQRVAALVQLLGSALLATAEAGHPSADGTRQLTVTVSENGRPVTQASVTATLPGAAATLTLSDDGQSGDGTANDGIYGGKLRGAAEEELAVVEVRSSAGNRLVPVELVGEQGSTTPLQVNAGGPYTVDEGGSLSLEATGEANLNYAWDLDGDGVFEAVGQSVSFSAVGVDGPASRLTRVRASDPATGMSATASALVTVENVAPTATLSAPATATVGQPFTLSLNGVSDAGGDPLQFAFDCGEGYGALVSAASTNCTPKRAGELTVRGRVQDDDGGIREYSAMLAVREGATVPACYVTGAQSVQRFSQGRQKSNEAVLLRRSDPSLALGLPQGDDTLNFVSLGFGGSLTLRFANPLVNDGTSKADIRVWETSFGDTQREWRREPEAARVEVSLDGLQWIEVGRTSEKDQAYDLVLPRAQFVRLTDITDPQQFAATADGFDLDAIEALTGCVRP